jgi:hypothetical protein
MNKYHFCLVFLTSSAISFGQLNFEAQFGGSNFLGGTLNSTYDIKISQNGLHRLTPIVGFGLLLPGWAGSTIILHSGLNYSYLNWGAGAEVSGFTDNPFWGSSYESDFSNMIIYPNINYTFNIKSNLFFKVSAGAWFAFTKESHYGDSKSKMVYDGDVIPGLGINLGYRFNLKPLNKIDEQRYAD